MQYKPQSTESVLRHVVLFGFTPETTPDQVRAIEDAFAALPGEIAEIIDFEWGVDVSVENAARGYTHCFLVTFRDGAARQVTAIEYIPPAGVDPRRLVTSLDVMVLPEGRLEPSGRPVISFSLPQSSESHIYAIPGRAEGRGLWLRVAGKGSMDSIVGDFRILSEGLAP